MKDPVRDIIRVILSSTSGLDDAMNIYDLFDAGVDGALLREILEILHKTGFVVDTHHSDAFKEVIANNVKACKKALKTGSNLVAEKELALLQETPGIFLGVYKEEETKILADSGTPLFIKQYKSDEYKLLQMGLLNKKTIILVDQKVVAYDSELYSHLLLN